MSENESTSAAAAEHSNDAATTAPAPSDEPANDTLAPTEATSLANETAVSIDAPALPAATEEDEAKPAGKESDLDMKAADTAEGAVSGATVVAPSGDVVTPNTKKSNGNNNSKRRSSAGIPEHKGKKLNKKKSMPKLHLDAEPGDYYWARMKGYPPWPAIVCDEEMLPESLLQTRPVTAMRPDGTYREDFQDGGKNARDRTYAVMYLGTYEFSWTPNVDLDPIDFDKLESADQGKKSKTLWEAYTLAKEKHDLQHYKDLLAKHEEALREDAEQIEKLEAEKAAKAEKKTSKEKRKSKVVVEEDADDEDVDMEDADADEAEPENETGKKAKGSKKRKKEADSEGEGAKPAKTPKTKLKVNMSKSAEGESATKSKSKAKVSKTKETPQTPQLTEAEKRQKREKEVLYFRHKLQKGFLSTDSPPKEAEMKQMGEHFTALEVHKDLDQSVIRTTKIHKVLRAILKLGSIPKDEEYNFKERSMKLLQEWQKILSENAEEADGEVNSKTNGDTGEPDSADGEAATSAGVKDDTVEKTEDEAAPSADVAEPAAAPVDTKTELGNDAADEATDGDVAMTDAKTDAPEAPADAEYKPPAEDAKIEVATTAA